MKVDKSSNPIFVLSFDVLCLKIALFRCDNLISIQIVQFYWEISNFDIPEVIAILAQMLVESDQSGN